MTAQNGPAPGEAVAGETLTGAGDWLVAADLAPDTADPGMAPVYEAAARGALALPFCAACSAPLELEQYVCDECGANAGVGTSGREGRDGSLPASPPTAPR